MYVFKVHYEKTSDGEDFDSFHTYLYNSSEGLERLSEAEWLYQSYESRESVFDALSRHLGGKGNVLVSPAFPDVTSPGHRQ